MKVTNHTSVIDDPSNLPVFANEGNVYYCESKNESYVMVVGEWVRFPGMISHTGFEVEENPLDKVIRTIGEDDG